MKTLGVVAFASDIVRARLQVSAAVRWLEMSQGPGTAWFCRYCSGRRRMWGAAKLQVAGPGRMMVRRTYQLLLAAQYANR